MHAQVKGNAIEWQKWQIRISFNWREGLVLHNVGYEDGGRVRPVLYRAAIAEMAVPYAEAQVGLLTHAWLKSMHRLVFWSGRWLVVEVVCSWRIVQLADKVGSFAHVTKAWLTTRQRQRHTIAA